MREKAGEKIVEAGLCTVIYIYETLENQEFRCTDWRLGGDCAVPGFGAHPECPRFCNAGEWFTIDEAKGKKIGEDFIDCVTQ